MGAVAALVLVVIALPGCGSGRSAGDRFSVVTTTPVLAALARSVAGEVTDVRSIMRAGTDPHGYQPSARDRRAMLEAGLLVVNGGNLEEGLLDVIDEATREGVPTLTALNAVNPVRDANDDLDPHFWHDPQQAAAVVRSLASLLAQLDPDRAASYERNAGTSIADLDRLGAEVEAVLAPVPPARRLLVTNHDAYRYFARRFDLQVVGTIIQGRSTQAAPSAAHLAGLAQAMRDQRICVVFAEESGSTAWAESLAREVGAATAVVRLYAGTLPDDGSYDTMVRDNATRIVTALGRCS